MSKPYSPYKRTSMFPTPRVVDVLFYETKQSDLAEFSKPPEYGTGHPDKNRFPHHTLVFVEPADDDGKQKWWYAADRDQQDLYNYQITYPYNGNTSAPRVTRTYLIPRDDYAALPQGSADSLIPDAVLVAQSMKPAEGQLASLYVEVTRVFDVVPGTDDSEGTGAGQTGTGYTVERPLGTLGYQRVVWTFTLPKGIAESMNSDGRADYTVCPIPGFSSLLLVGEDIQSAEGNDQAAVVRRTYVAEQTVPTKEFSRLTPQLEPPSNFTDFIQRRKEELSVLTAGNSPALEPDTPDGWSATVPNSAQVQSTVAMQTLLTGAKQRIVSEYAYGSLEARQWDPQLERHLRVVRHIVPRTQLDAWVAANVDLSYQFYETAPQNRGWTEVTVIDLPIGSQQNPALDYFSTDTFAWPRVLKTYNLLTVPAKANGAVAYDVTLGTFEYKEPFSGICRTRIRRWWQKAKPTDEPIQFLQPTGLVLDWPIAQLQLEECLHPPISFSGTTGTNHPAYGYYAFSKQLEGTTLRGKAPESITQAWDWPDSLCSDFDIAPYRGGYLCTRTDVYKPY